MKIKHRITAVLLALCLALGCFGCQSGSLPESRPDVLSSSVSVQESSIPEVTPTPKPTEESKKDLSGELTIRYHAEYEGYSLSEVAQSFEREYPNVTVMILYENGDTEFYTGSMTYRDRRESARKYGRTITDEIENGQADYIVFDPTANMDIARLSESGKLVDLLPLFENDPEIDPNDFYLNVLEAMKIKGKLPVMPYAFSWDHAYINRTVLEESDLGELPEVSPSALLDLYGKAREKTPDLNFIFTSLGKDMLFSVAEHDFMEPETGIAKFDSQECISYLERSREVENSDPALDPVREIGMAGMSVASGNFEERTRLEAGASRADQMAKIYSDSGNTYGNNIVTASRNSFALLNCAETGYESFQAACIAYDQPYAYTGGPYLLLDKQGRLGITPVDSFMVPTSCKNQKLAWEFIKYCLRTRKNYLIGEMPYTRCIPINRRNVETALKYFRSTISSNIIGFGMEDLELDLDIDEVREKLGAVLDRELEQYVCNAFYGPNVDDILAEYYEEGSLSAEECAEQLQAVAEEWLGAY